jgi:hypothetical protein
MRQREVRDGRSDCFGQSLENGLQSLFVNTQCRFLKGDGLDVAFALLRPRRRLGLHCHQIDSDIARLHGVAEPLLIFVRAT